MSPSAVPAQRIGRACSSDARPSAATATPAAPPSRGRRRRRSARAGSSTPRTARGWHGREPGCRPASPRPAPTRRATCTRLRDTSRRSSNRSCTSAPVLVMPQAMRALCPMIDERHAGNGHARARRGRPPRGAARTRPRGTRSCRCGSLASIGRPLLVRRARRPPSCCCCRAWRLGCSHSRPAGQSRGFARCSAGGLRGAGASVPRRPAAGQRGAGRPTAEAAEAGRRTQDRRARPRDSAPPSCRAASAPSFAASGGAHQLGLVVLGQAPRQQAADGQRVLRRPRRRA